MIDEAAQKLWDAAMLEAELSEYEDEFRCASCGSLVSVLRHKENLYSVTCKGCPKITLVEADSKEQAVEFANDTW